jgi:hypothetical protein
VPQHSPPEQNPIRFFKTAKRPLRLRMFPLTLALTFRGLGRWSLPFLFCRARGFRFLLYRLRRRRGFAR